MQTTNDLARFIEWQGIAAQLVHPRHETRTVPLAAQAMDCQEDQIIKSVLFLVKTGNEKRPVLVISNGAAPIDSRKLAALFGVGRKRIKLAGADVVLALTGYPAGGVPPFGFPRPVETLIDRRVLDQPLVFGGGGDEQTLMQITPQELLRVTGGQLIDTR